MTCGIRSFIGNCIILSLYIAIFSLTACTTPQPANIDDVCAIFQENEDWYEDSKQAFEQWGVPIHLQMAFIYQESKFIADAQPKRSYLLGFIPWSRASSAYGYPQAKDSTWDWFREKTGNSGADRDDFSDSCDFIGWYCSISHAQLGISKWDAYRQYLAYHEGHGGYKKKSFQRKKWLLQVAKKVDKRAKKYHMQIKGCHEDLENKSWFFW